MGLLIYGLVFLQQNMSFYSFSKRTKVFWQFFARRLLFFIFLGVLVFLYTLIASAQEKQSVSDVIKNTIVLRTVSVTANVNLECTQNLLGNWHTTLKSYDGDEQAMLAANGFTPESFAEYCASIP